MDSQKRTLLAMGISFAMVMVYLFLFPPKTPPREQNAAQAVTLDGGSEVGGLRGNESASASPGQTPGANAGPGALTQKSANAPLHRDITVERPLVHYVFSSDGAGLSSAVLQGERMRYQQQVTFAQGWQRVFGKKFPPSPQVNLAVPAAGEPLPFSVAITGPTPLDAHAAYSVEGTAAAHKLVFTAEQNGWHVTKTFQWVDDGFELAMLLNVENRSATVRSGELALYDVRAGDPTQEQAPSMLGSIGNQTQPSCYVEDKYRQQRPTEKPGEEFKGKVNFLGVDHQYFLSALYPLDGPVTGRCTVHATETLRVATLFLPLNLAPGQSSTQRFGIYTGPRDTTLLAVAPSGALRALGEGQTLASLSPDRLPKLEKAVDYGYFAVICQVLLVVLKFFHRFVGNWGVAIILLTVSVKIALLPLTHRMMIGQEAMKKLQPKLEAMKKKFANDKEAQQREQMKLFQQEGVNPAGSCLLLVVQMPVWFALFTTLRNSYDIYREPFFGSLYTDLTFKDPTFLLPVLLGVSQLITTRLQPQPGMDPSQARIMNWFMPIVFTAFLLNYPMGLTLYIFTNNVISVAQTYGIRKWLQRRGGGGANPPAGKKTLVARTTEGLARS